MPGLDSVLIRNPTAFTDPAINPAVRMHPLVQLDWLHLQCLGCIAQAESAGSIRNAIMSLDLWCLLLYLFFKSKLFLLRLHCQLNQLQSSQIGRTKGSL